MEALDKYEADILAMSAFLTTTAPEQRRVIDSLEEKDIREGEGSITADFAKSIGADVYSPTSPGPVELARKLVGK